MADGPRLLTPRIHVVMDDGSEYDVQCLNPDLIRYDRTAAKQKWPGVKDAPFLYLTFVAWAAMRRLGHIGEDVTWTDFSERRCYSVSSSDPANGVPVEEAGAVFPIRADPVPE